MAQHSATPISAPSLLSYKCKVISQPVASVTTRAARAEKNLKSCFLVRVLQNLKICQFMCLFLMSFHRGSEFGKLQPCLTRIFRAFRHYFHLLKCCCGRIIQCAQYARAQGAHHIGAPTTSKQEKM